MILIVVKFTTKPDWSERWREHFKEAIRTLPAALAETPRIINVTIDGADDWSRMAEMTIE